MSQTSLEALQLTGQPSFGGRHTQPLLGFLAGFVVAFLLCCGTPEAWRARIGHTVLPSVPQTTPVVRAMAPPSGLPSRRQTLAAAASALVAARAGGAQAQAEGDNDLDAASLLPPGPPMNVVDKVQLLTNSQMKEATRLIDGVEARYGVKLRVLIQKSPLPPGRRRRWAALLSEAVSEYWQADRNTVILIVDDSFPNLLHFIADEKLPVGPSYWRPGRFWIHLASDYGTLKYVRENGEDQAVLNALRAIDEGLAVARV